MILSLELKQITDQWHFLYQTNDFAFPIFPGEAVQRDVEGDEHYCGGDERS